VLLLAALSASAAPVITSIDPNVGFTFGGTRVTIRGSGFLAPNDVCPRLPPSGTGLITCAVQVYVGGVQAYVLTATPTEIVASIQATNTGQPRQPGYAHVRIVSEANGETTLANGFLFDEKATPGIENYTRFLVPLTAHEVPGANGSLWSTELTLFNASIVSMQVLGSFDDPNDLFVSDPPVLAPGETRTLRLYPSTSVPGDGAYVYVPAPLRPAAVMSLRVRDISKNAQSWGTEVPVVRSNDVRPRITLIDIPTDRRYRATLRVYHWTETAHAARVSIYVPDREPPIRVYELGPPPVSTNPGLPLHPAYQALDILTDDVRAAGSSLRIEIEHTGPSGTPLPYDLWAFVSITNNETQQVTAILPTR
jgi:hypothetical protein